MDYLKIRNWDKWQSYRKDRGQPPWIKLHRELLRHPEWASLSDSQRGQLVVIWLLAADRDGSIPASPEIIQKIGLLDEAPNLELFIEQGFIEHDANVTPIRRQVDRTESDTEVETETEKKENSDSVPQKSPDCPYSKIVNLYHQTLPELPKVEKLTDARKTTIRKIWREDLKELDAWGHFFTYVRSSEFLMGNVAPINGRRVFKANLEWITKPANFVKISEEFYHG